VLSQLRGYFIRNIFYCIVLCNYSDQSLSDIAYQTQLFMRKPHSFILLILSFYTNIFGQENPIKDATYHFSIQGDIFRGKGADTLKKYIQQSQFFMLGEEHNMKELQDFTASVIPLLKSSGYRHLALEIGPVAATKLTAVYRSSEGLAALNTKYFQYLNGAPFGFFEGKEEEWFSNRAFENGFDVWGIDFENYNASLFIIDELFEQSRKSSELSEMYNNSRRLIIDAYKRDRSEKKHQLATTLLNSEPIKSFFNKVSTTSKLREIIRQQILSWQIYEQQGKGNWYPRVENMKANFVKSYQRAAAKEKKPKVFIKMGAVHIARGTSSSGFQELGNMVFELSNLNATKSFSVISFARYRIDAKGETVDLLEEEDAELLKYTLTDSWSLIDLNRLRKDAVEGRMKLSKEMMAYMQKFDMMLIPPATKYMEPNYLPK